jgi:hypothetical protein
MRRNVETAKNLLTLKAKAGSGLWHADVELFILSALGAFRQ